MFLCITKRTGNGRWHVLKIKNRRPSKTLHSYQNRFLWARYPSTSLRRNVSPLGLPEPLPRAQCPLPPVKSSGVWFRRYRTLQYRDTSYETRCSRVGRSLFPYICTAQRKPLIGTLVGQYKCKLVVLRVVVLRAVASSREE